MSGQYIGSEHTIKIYQNSINPSDNTWEANKTYAPLTVVKYNGKSYISKQQTPSNIGNPASNTTYWKEIDTLPSRINSIPTNRKWVLIGDSFGCGIVTSSPTDTDGWIDYFEDIFPDRTFRYNPNTDTSLSGLSAFTTSSAANFINQLNYIYDNKMGNTPSEQITDVVVLGGTNEVSGATISDIADAIETFCARARTLYPNAEISIGIVGVKGQYMVYGSNIYKGYRQGAMRNGAKFLRDCINLGTDPSKVSSTDHWTIEGYGRNNLYIAEMILHGSVDYSIKANIPLGSITSDITNPTSMTFYLDCIICNSSIQFRFYINNGYNAGYVRLAYKPETYASTRSKKMIQLASDNFNLVYLLGNGIFECTYVFSRGDSYANQIGGKGTMRILLDGGHYYLTYQVAYPFEGSYKTSSNAYALLSWDANSREVNSYVELD